MINVMLNSASSPVIPNMQNKKSKVLLKMLLIIMYTRKVWEQDLDTVDDEKLLNVRFIDLFLKRTSVLHSWRILLLYSVLFPVSLWRSKCKNILESDSEMQEETCPGLLICLQSHRET